MSETNVKEIQEVTEVVNEVPEVVEELTEVVEEVVEKPYTFRRFSSTDIFPMFRIIGKIGLKEFTAAIDKDVLNELVTKFIQDNKEEKEDGNIEINFADFAAGGASVILGIADVILSKLEYCEKDIYQLLSQTSNLSFDEVKALDGAVFLEMIIDFIMKDDFKDFIKVVSKRFK